MSHEDQSHASDVVTATHSSLRAEAEELRRQIGSENMNQSGVIASRRLDEALLRLDLAAGRKRSTNSSISSTRIRVPQSKSLPRRPRSTHSAPASDLELDESIAQSSSVWLEPTESQGTRYRLDPAPARTNPPRAHVKPSDVVEPTEPVQESEPIEQPEPEAVHPASTSRLPATPLPSQTQSTQASINTFADLFAAPIDVMLSSDPNDDADTEREQIVTSVPESKWKPRVETVTQPEVKATSEPVSEPDSIESASTAVESAPEIEKITDNVKEEAVVQETEPPIAVAESAKELRPFHATWQVDEFVVPSTVDELFLAGSIAEQLATRLAEARTDGLHTIAVTSPKPGEGRSTVAMGMALSVAFSGLRVALVDADPQGVKLATDLQLDLEYSWIDSVRTDLPLEETAVFSQADALTLIPLLEIDAELPMNVSELRRLLDQLKETFDIVVVDCGASAIDAVALCDTALIVRDVLRTKALEVETLAMSLRRKGLQGIGVVENFCPQ